MVLEDKSKQGWTRDAIYGGRLVLLQPARGYRFSIDAVLLTAFAAEGGPARRAVDFGAGCGAVGLGLLAAGAAGRVVAVEVQGALAELASRNAALNELRERYAVVTGDIRGRNDALPPGGFDLVATNPPFWPAGTGRPPHDEERRVACHEVLCGIDEWIASAARLLKPRRGRLVVVFPARRLDALLLALDRARLSGTRLRLVHPREGEAAELVLLEARVGAPGRLRVEAPLVLKREDGADTEEVTRLVSGAFSDALRARPARGAPRT